MPRAQNEHGKLYLVTYEYGSFSLNEEAQTFEEVPANTTYAISRINKGKEILVEKGNLRWTIDAENCEGRETILSSSISGAYILLKMLSRMCFPT